MPRGKTSARKPREQDAARASSSRATLTVAALTRLRRCDTHLPLLRRVALAAARAEGFRRGELSIAVVGRAAMRTLHRRFMDDDSPTDVLTFDLGTDARAGALAGEIVVCADVAAAEARRRQLAFAHETALYVVHGVLHLAGYDDHAPAAFRRMHAREDELLRCAGLGAVFAR
jgi:probable rRNA maturation factor